MRPALLFRLPRASASVVSTCSTTSASASATATATASATTTTALRLPSRAPFQPLLRRWIHASAPVLAQKPFHLPDIGEGIAEVEVLEVCVAPGDRVTQFDSKLFEVQSDKATVDITSPFDGVVVAVHCASGDIVATGSNMMDVEIDGEAGEEAASTPAADTPAASASAPSSAPSSSPSSSSEGARSSTPTGGPKVGLKSLATPAVRRLAKEHDIDLSQVAGTGKEGRVLKGDILAFIAGDVPPADQQTTDAAPSTPTPAAPEPVAAAPTPTSTSPAPVFVGAKDDVTVPVRGIQRAMVKSMNTAWSVPHFGYCDEVEMDGLMSLRNELKPLAEAKGVKFSYLPIILKATSLALGSFPSLNAHCNSDASEVVHRGAHNIGIAMDTPRGLVVPNVKNVESRTLVEIAEELGRLQALGKEGRLGEGDLTDGTFTLSNIGVIGGTYASPVLMMPQVAIGALGKVERVPKFVSADSLDVTAAHVMKVSWAADHRVVDGATMARFSNMWKTYLEAPNTMLADMK